MIKTYYTHLQDQSAFDIGQLHSTLLIFSWIFLANVGLWAHFFKYRSWALQLHKAVMALLTLLTSISVFMAIAYFGFSNDMPPLHVWLGFAIGLLCLIASAGGIVCSIIQSSPSVSPSVVNLSRKLHKIVGWGVLALILAQFISTLKKRLIIAALVVNLISYGLFILLKLTRSKMQKTSMNNIKNTNEFNSQLRSIKSRKDLSIYNNDYYIFANKVYDINSVINNHPGGWEIIKAIKTRQVDRYLYGIEPLENLSGKQVNIHKHTNSSLSMIGQPLAQLYSPVFYKNYHQINSVGIEELGKPCKNQSMHAVYLGSKEQKFQYKGYSQLNELGKYYTVNMGNLTKLYSIVNFLHQANLSAMSKIVGNVFWQQNKVVSQDGRMHEGIINQKRNQLNQFLLPLFIKKYEKGAFTSQFLSGHCTNQAKISTPMGRGLSLHEAPPGIILMLAAGTGINPFCDLIDLVFKQTLILQRHPLSGELTKNDSILSLTPFRNWHFVLYASVQQITEIHPITLFQCNQLAKRKRLSLKIRSKDINSMEYKKYPNIEKVQKRFESVVKQWVSYGDKLSQIYICGTPQFNASIVKQLQNYEVPLQKYKIM